jgi:hypothetical protein
MPGSSILQLAFIFLIPIAYGDVCPDGKYFRHAHSRSAYHRADGTFVHATHVSQSCVSKGPGYDFWFPKLKSGIPPNWPHKEGFAKWTDDERERVLEALDELPPDLRSEYLKGIFRLSKSKDFPNPASHGGHMIILYDTAFGTDRTLARILAHELGHENYNNLTYEAQHDYRMTTGWTLEEANRKIYWKERPGDFVKDNGRREPEEDYANNLEYFLFDPDVLNKKTPSAFKWMKKHFGDKFKVGGRK